MHHKNYELIEATFAVTPRYIDCSDVPTAKGRILSKRASQSRAPSRDLTRRYGGRTLRPRAG